MYLTPKYWPPHHMNTHNGRPYLEVRPSCSHDRLCAVENEQLQILVTQWEWLKTAVYTVVMSPHIFHVTQWLEYWTFLGWERWESEREGEGGHRDRERDRERYRETVVSFPWQAAMAWENVFLFKNSILL